MLTSWRPFAAMLLTAAMGAALVGAAPANAVPVESGSLTMTSDPGDWVGGGQSYDFSVAAGDSFDAAALDNGEWVSVNIIPAGGFFWFLNFAAPRGQMLAPGVYAGATRAAFRAPDEPGIDISGDGRGCNTITGSFIVNAITLGPQGYVQTFDATFEQHCEGLEPALRGHVVINNPPPPAALQLGPAVASDGVVNGVNGNATVHGALTCNKPVDVTVAGRVTQVVKRTIVRGSFSKIVACTPDEPAAWEATAMPSGSVPFQKGDAEVSVTAVATDPFYGNQVIVDNSATVQLTKK